MKKCFHIILFILIFGIIFFLKITNNAPWTKKELDSNTLFLSYASQIRNLDAASAYYVHESTILDNIVEAPLTYHYLKRPYQLQPQLLKSIPQPVYRDEKGNEFAPEQEPDRTIASVEYLLEVQPGIYYQPHPCFGNQKRELSAQDFQVAIARLSDTRTSSPVFTNVSSFLPGIEAASAQISTAVENMDNLRHEQGATPAELLKYPSLPDYRKIKIPGVEVIDQYTLKINLSRRYPQFTYWLAMHFFAPVPWEALAWYNQREIIDEGGNFSNSPVGTGAYMLEKFDPNERIVLVRNPNFRHLTYPADGTAEDQAKGLLKDAGQTLPFIDSIVYKYEPEAIPSWLKFLQGYYDINGDNSGIPLDLMDSAITLNPLTGDMELSEEMAKRGLKMDSSVMLTSYYFAFNFLDPVVGGLDERHRALRQAISIAMDMNEYIDIFKNGNGQVSETILPPGIFGYQPAEEKLNQVIHKWNPVLRRAENHELETAKRLMEKAGYPGGIGPDGKPLVIHLDHAAAGNPNFKPRFAWMTHRLAQLGIILEERQSDLNRQREKIELGNWQMQFERGWVADYPDPENFLMMFYGPNGIVKSHGCGCNNFNYDSPEFNALFEQLETMGNSPERQKLITQACDIIARDAPIVMGYYPVNTVLTHSWLNNYKPNAISYDKLKYLKLDYDARLKAQEKWNKPIIWPIYSVLIMLKLTLIASVIFDFIRHRKNKTNA